ncbi:MAG: asparagine synthetase B family protein, partial [Planctomycetota bacterium]
MQSIVGHVGSIERGRALLPSGLHGPAEPVVVETRSSRPGLATARLGALDPAPSVSADRRVALAWDGELYNASELRSTLPGGIDLPRGAGEPELILAAYAAWGEALVERLRGAFAFALWDARGDGRLFLARDPFGQRPLYYHKDGEGNLSFSSQVRALFRKDAPREVDPESVRFYLGHGHPPPDRGIRRDFPAVPPGRMLTWEDRRLSTWSFRPPPGAHPLTVIPASSDPVRELRDQLEDAVARRLDGSRSTGVLLSGGIGSGAVLACAAALAGGGVRSYTACLGAGGIRECERARQTALALNTRHRVFMVNARCAALLPFLASQTGEPCGDPRELAAHLLRRRAAQETDLLLSGKGTPTAGHHPPASTALTSGRGLRMPLLDAELVDWLRRAQERMGPKWPGARRLLGAAFADVLPVRLRRARK